MPRSCLQWHLFTQAFYMGKYNNQKPNKNCMMISNILLQKLIIQIKLDFQLWTQKLKASSQSSILEQCSLFRYIFEDPLHPVSDPFSTRCWTRLYLPDSVLKQYLLDFLKIISAHDYLDGVKTETLRYLSCCCWPYQILFVCVHQNRNSNQLLLT